MHLLLKSGSTRTIFFLIFLFFFTFVILIDRSLLPKCNRGRIESIELYQMESTKELRRMALQTAGYHRQLLVKRAKQANGTKFYQSVKVEALCTNKIRIGGEGDGGKYVCNPSKVNTDCTLVSLGLNNAIDYDTQIYEVTGKQCKILGADISAQSPATKYAYDKMNGELFVGNIPQTLTISSMLKKAGRREIELLKIDIEGGEFASMEPLISEHFVCQIFIEIHGHPTRHLEMLQVLSKYGFRVFNVDENPFCSTCCEYSLINDLCMAQFSVVPLANVIPQVKDSNTT